MKIDFQLLHKIFFVNVLLMVLVVILDIYFEGYTGYYVALLPFINTAWMYYYEKKYGLFTQKD